MLGLTLLLPNAAQADEADDLARQLQARVAELEALRADLDTERAQQQRERDALTEQVERLRHDLRATEAEADELAEAVAHLRDERSTIQADREQLAAAMSVLADAADTASNNLHDQVAKGVTAAREDRLHAIARTREQLASEDPPQRLDALASFVDFAGEELQRLDQRELRNEPVAVGDRQKHAFVYRLGLVAEGFVSEDGTSAGVFDPQQNGWRLDVASEAERLQAVIDTMRDRRPPAVIAVPILRDVQVEASHEDGQVTLE